VHVYVIRQDPVTLIDTGVDIPESREALIDGLKQHGLTARDIRRVLLTHAHVDHMGLAAWVREESGAEIWLHPDEAGKGDDLARMQAFTWLCTVAASALSLPTTVSAPTRSQYSPKFLENELHTNNSAPGLANARKPAASSSMPSAKPW